MTAAGVKWLVVKHLHVPFRVLAFAATLRSLFFAKLKPHAAPMSRVPVGQRKPLCDQRMLVAQSATRVNTMAGESPVRVIL